MVALRGLNFRSLETGNRGNCTESGTDPPDGESIGQSRVMTEVGEDLADDV